MRGTSKMDEWEEQAYLTKDHQLLKYLFDSKKRKEPCSLALRAPQRLRSLIIKSVAKRNFWKGKSGRLLSQSSQAMEGRLTHIIRRSRRDETDDPIARLTDRLKEQCLKRVKEQRRTLALAMRERRLDPHSNSQYYDFVFII